MFVERDDGALICSLVAGDGDPTTLFVHGLGQSAPDARIFGSGIAGTRVFMDLRGHGNSTSSSTTPAKEWTYATLAADTAATAEAAQATRALGVSTGASTLACLVSQQPHRLERLVLVMPTAVSQAREEATLAVIDQIADAIAANDQIVLTRLLPLLQPQSTRDRMDVAMWARRMAAELGGSRVAAPMRELPRQIAVPDVATLRNVSAAVLVLAQRGDEAHPVGAAEDIAGMFRDVRLIVSDDPWIWTGRKHLRDTLVEFLNS